MKNRDIHVREYAHTSAMLMHHITENEKLWDSLYLAALTREKGWVELGYDIAELAILYEDYWQSFKEDEIEWLEGIFEITNIILDHYKNETPFKAVIVEACERVEKKENEKRP